ncbi:MAG: SLC13 family permease [Planctomycetota bacterium]|nr:SLC13 family permease [Planctomycetota bacterium]
MDPKEILTIVAIGCVMASAMIPALSIDMAAVIALAMIVAGGVIEPGVAALGFGNPVVLTVAGMFIVAEALHRTGAVEGLADLVQKRAASGQRALLLALLPTVMILSGVMNNTGVVVLLLPALVDVAQRIKVSPSRLLLPLSYASIAGGTLTLVGTTTTLLVDGLVRDHQRTEGLEVTGLGFLDILPMGAIFCVATLAYLVVVGPKLLPNRVGMVTAITPGTIREYMTEVVLSPRSRLVGQSLDTVRSLIEGIRVLQIVRGEERLPPPFHKVTLQAEDTLIVKGKPDELIDILSQRGVLHALESERKSKISGVDLALAEVMVPPRSTLDGMTVHEAHLRERFGIVVLAVLRRGAHLREKLASVRLAVGDVLLVQGDAEDVERLSREEDDLIRLGGTPPEAPNRSRAPIAIAVAFTSLAAAAVLNFPLWTAVMMASVILVVSGCLNSAQAYRSINLRIVVILGCMLGLGMAVKKTGLADDIATALVGWAGDAGPRAVLAMIYVATVIITELVTNAATAGIMVPIAISTADKLEVSGDPFIFAVALAASCSFLTPVGYQTNLLVYGPGGYRLQDYLRLGAPLSILLWILAIVFLPIVFPFYPA